MNPKNLLAIAKRLASGPKRGRPRQEDLRRAVSTAYYAMFHALARSNANLLVGSTRANRSDQAWRQLYRALDHSPAASAARGQQMAKFPQEIQDFAGQFVKMQSQRHTADYDPLETFSRSDVLQVIQETTLAIEGFNRATTLDKRKNRQSSLSAKPVLWIPGPTARRRRGQGETEPTRQPRQLSEQSGRFVS